MKYKIIIMIFLFCGCERENNPCEIVKEGENYVLNDSAKALVNNYIHADRMIFKTLAGDEVSFDVIEKDTIGSYQVGFPCEVDTSENQTTKGTSQILTYSLINNAIISEPVVISLFEFPEVPTRQAEETLAVSLGEYFTNSFGNGDELFYYVLNSHNSHLNYLDSLLIGGKTFYSVYEMNNNIAQNLEVKYTLDQGIIYMNNPTNSIEYIYERKE
ncbi:MAG: hypothetical protein ACPG49_08345 [Chitinophagales bacterium]